MTFRDENQNQRTAGSTAATAPGGARRAFRKLTLDRERLTVLRVETALRTGLATTSPPISIRQMASCAFCEV